ncbi:hypothetical protein BGZ97_010429 [Linnemannia gamsii]|uniref:Uncharacterized protein n=1 Tax=Linnemannia gamsii TaxID=64522 RepID=A0A9P6R9L7_9FUNG|nr:hypothetical protein BGZ97_010429 [Linnemannia gamsii]
MRNVSKEEHINVLQHAQVNSLVDIQFNVTHDLVARVKFFDILRPEQVFVLAHDPTSELFQHQRVNTLATWTDLVPEFPYNPEVSIRSLRDEFSRQCPYLSKVDFDGGEVDLYHGDNLLGRNLLSQPDENHSAKNPLKLILRSCRSLEVPSAKAHRMDMDLAEEYQWFCNGLKELRVRVQGLETVVAIDDCLERLSLLRKYVG